MLKRANNAKILKIFIRYIWVKSPDPQAFIPQARQL